MNISIEEKKTEAVDRLKKLRIFPETIKQFEKDGKVSRSEPPFGAFFWVEGDDLKKLRKFEEHYSALVYLVIRTYTGIGVMDSYLYVSDYREEWADDRQRLTENETFAWVENLDAPDCSEFGSIGFTYSPAASLLRVW